MFGKLVFVGIHDDILSRFADICVFEVFGIFENGDIWILRYRSTPANEVCCSLIYYMI